MESQAEVLESMSTASEHTRQVIFVSLLLDIRDLLEQGLKVSNEVHEMLWMERNPIFWVDEQGKPGRLERIPPGGRIDVEKMEGTEVRKIVPRDFETATGDLKEALDKLDPQDGMVEMTSHEYDKNWERRGTYTVGASPNTQVVSGEGEGIEGDVRPSSVAQPRQESDPG